MKLVFARSWRFASSLSLVGLASQTIGRRGGPPFRPRSPLLAGEARAPPPRGECLGRGVSGVRDTETRVLASDTVLSGDRFHPDSHRAAGPRLLLSDEKSFCGLGRAGQAAGTPPRSRALPPGSRTPRGPARTNSAPRNLFFSRRGARGPREGLCGAAGKNVVDRVRQPSRARSSRVRRRV